MRGHRPLRGLVPALQAQFPASSRSRERDLLVARTAILLQGGTRRIGLRPALESPRLDARSGVSARRDRPESKLLPLDITSPISVSRAVHPITGLWRSLALAFRNCGRHPLPFHGRPSPHAN